MLSRVGATDDRRGGPLVVGDAEGVGEALGGQGLSRRRPRGRHSVLRVGDRGGRGDRPGDDEGGEVQAQLADVVAAGADADGAGPRGHRGAVEVGAVLARRGAAVDGQHAAGAVSAYS